MKKINCLGPAFSNTHIAGLNRYPDSQYEFLSQHLSCLQLKKGLADIAIIPLRNNHEGYVDDSIKAILKNKDIVIFDRVELKIKHNLISRSKIENIQSICSHPKALAQCENSIKKLYSNLNKKPKIVPLSSTSEGVLLASKDSTVAAIGTYEAASYYNLPILAENFQDHDDNATEFIFLKRGRTIQASTDCNSVFLAELNKQSKKILFGMFGKLLIKPFDFYPIKGLQDYYFITISGHPKDMSHPLSSLYHFFKKRERFGSNRKLKWVGTYLLKRAC
ncbi:MAG: hypothetical protein H7A25_06295 [Leptospiraceae bacterium]|nr:hypothetical protein [Leptospiraceae bacterium]MCP5499494.1 hypothetical protein [Leptospiraceae bacterium]